MPDHDQIIFNCLHHDADGKLLACDEVTGVKSSYSDYVSVGLPEFDLRDGDSITLTVKPVRPALVAPTTEFAEVEPVEIEPSTTPAKPIVGKVTQEADDGIL